jgi:5-formyltetrahydrofolate cyclo-ligase
MKQALRRRLLNRRNSLASETIEQLSLQISGRLFELQEFQSATTVSTYLNMGSEVSTSQIVSRCISSGKRVIVPVTNRARKRLIFSEIKDIGKELELGTFGIREPRPEFLRPVPLEEAQIVLVPAIAWDYRGYRIGYGGGYYDRTINSLHTPLVMIGLGYEFQIIERIPNNRYDRRVNKLVTERRVVNTRAMNGR